MSRINESLLPDFRTIIIDDEENSRLLIKSRLEKLFSNITVVDMCGDVPTALDGIIKHKPDFVFLDIQMPGLTGLDLVESIKTIEPSPKVIIISAYPDPVYFQSAIRNGVCDYILKPFTSEDIKRSVDSVIEKLSISEIEVFENTWDEKISFKSVFSQIITNPNDILFIKADGKYTMFYLTNQKSEMVMMGISHAYEQLEQLGFLLKIDRSTIVNRKYIYKVHKKLRMVVFIANGQETNLEVSFKGVSTLEKEFLE
jgi:two-component system LytT family response regulator